MPGRGGTWALSEFEVLARECSKRNAFMLWLFGPSKKDLIRAHRIMGVRWGHYRPESCHCGRALNLKVERAA